MAAADVSGLVDLISTPDPTPSASESTPETPVETDVVEEVETEESPELEQENPDDPQSDPDGEKPVDGRTNPAAIRSALKAFRDASPENAAAARSLNDAYGRWTAAKELFPGGVSEMKATKAVLDAVGGQDGLTNLQNTIKSVNETDAMLYSGDGKVLENLYEDMKSEGKQDAFAKLAGPYLEKLLAVDPKGYDAAVRPHFYQGLVQSNLPGVLGALTEALSGATPNLDAAKAILGNMSKWFDGLRDSVEAGAKANLDPERQAFQQEQQKFRTDQQKAFQADVHTSWNGENNRALGTSLKPYLKMSFAKNWTNETKVSVAREVQQTLMEQLSGDKTYQSQMDAFWSESKPDKSRIINFHKSKVDILAPKVVKSVLNARYPGFQSVRAAGVKPGTKPGVAGAKPPVQAPGQPLQVKAKPADHLIAWDKDPTRMLFITGKAYLKDGRFVRWGAAKK